MTGHRQTRDASVERPAGEMSIECASCLQCFVGWVAGRASSL